VRDLLQAALDQHPGVLARDDLAADDRRPDTVQRLAKHASITPAGGLGEPCIGRQEPLTAQRGEADPGPRGQAFELGVAVQLSAHASHDRATGTGRHLASYGCCTAPSVDRLTDRETAPCLSNSALINASPR